MSGMSGPGGESGGPVPGGLGSLTAAGRARPGGGCRPGRQPCAAAVPSGLRAVRHQRVRGWRAAAAARSRASSPSRGPNPSASPGASARRCQVASGMVRVTSAARLGPDAEPGPTGARPGPRGRGRRDRRPRRQGRQDHGSRRVRPIRRQVRSRPIRRRVRSRAGCHRVRGRAGCQRAPRRRREGDPPPGRGCRAPATGWAARRGPVPVVVGAGLFRAAFRRTRRAPFDAPGSLVTMPRA